MPYEKRSEISWGESSEKLRPLDGEAESVPASARLVAASNATSATSATPTVRNRPLAMHRLVNRDTFACLDDVPFLAAVDE